MSCPTTITVRSPGDLPPNGPPGGQGWQGTQGPQGYQGWQGVQGTQGPCCPGPQGNPGRDGYDGYQGPQGFQGAGYQGTEGIPGQQGYQGADGTGYQGSPGPQGPGGTDGSQGPQGFQGVAGAGSQDLYTNTNPTPTTVGGIAAGSTFNSQTMQQMWDMLLYPYQPPSFSSFSMSGQATTVEVGTTISGTKTFTWGTNNSSNIQANSITIKDSTGGTTLGSALANSGSYSVNIVSVQKTSQASNTWTITGTNTESSNFSANFVVNWDWRFYYGTNTNTTLAASDIQALSSSLLTTGYARTYSYPGGGYKYLCYPTSISAVSSFKDASNNLNVAMADSSDDPSYSNVSNGLYYAVVSVTNSLSQTTNYRVYRTKNILGGSINIVAA